jgi:hypothetical protein
MDTESGADSDEPKDMLDVFLECSGMDFWELLAEQTNLKSVYDRMHSLYTTSEEILQLTRVELVVGTLNFPQDKLYWSRLLRLLMIR